VSGRSAATASDLYCRQEYVEWRMKSTPADVIADFADIVPAIMTVVTSVILTLFERFSDLSRIDLFYHKQRSCKTPPIENLVPIVSAEGECLRLI